MYVYKQYLSMISLRVFFNQLLMLNNPMKRLFNIEHVAIRVKCFDVMLAEKDPAYL